MRKYFNSKDSKKYKIICARNPPLLLRYLVHACDSTSAHTPVPKARVRTPMSTHDVVVRVLHDVHLVAHNSGYSYNTPVIVVVVAAAIAEVVVVVVVSFAAFYAHYVI